MAIKGKKEYKVYLSAEEAEFVKKVIDDKKYMGGFSGLIDDYVKKIYRTLKSAGIKEGEKVNTAKIIRLFFNGMKNSVD
jgi:hypothetical protein